MKSPAPPLPDDDLPRLCTVDLHVAGEHGDILFRELREKLRFSDEPEDPPGNRRTAAKPLKPR